MMGWFDGPTWLAVIGMTVLMIVFCGLVILGVVVVWDGWRRTDRPHDDRQDAEVLLDERFARGDIDADEYAQRRRLLHVGQ